MQIGSLAAYLQDEVKVGPDRKLADLFPIQRHKTSRVILSPVASTPKCAPQVVGSDQAWSKEEQNRWMDEF
eukprot:2499875-Rhodomonas_salina.1